MSDTQKIDKIIEKVNKRKKLWAILIISIGIFLMIIGIKSGYIIVDNPAKECSEQCINFGFEYVLYDNSGFSSVECWCVKDDQVIQIY